MFKTGLSKIGASSKDVSTVGFESTSANDFADLRDLLDTLRPSPRRRWAVMEREDTSATHGTSRRHLVVWPPCGLPLPEFQVKRVGDKVEVTAFEENGAVLACRFTSMPAALATLRRELGARLAPVEPSRKREIALNW